MKKVISACLLVGACFVVSALFAKDDNSINFNADGYQTNKDGWINQVDRNRAFDRFELTCPISTEKTFSGVTDDDGKPIKMLPFESARVRTLVIDGNEVSKKLGTYSFETISLKGVQELSQIVIRGRIPKFSENRKWYGAKDADWRRGLRRIEFVDHVADIDSIPFLGDVKCIALGPNTAGDVQGWKNIGWKGLAKCHGLEVLEVPYSMATNTAIDWRAIISHTPLKKKEVVSSDLGAGVEGSEEHIVLLNVSTSGVISDFVTQIRADAIPENFGDPVYLPR